MNDTQTPPKRRRKTWRKRFREFSQSGAVVSVLSTLGIWYLKLVQKTNKFVVEPTDALAQVEGEQPFIVSVWHGQHVLAPAIPIGIQASALISRNVDGEITARIVEHFGNKTIRASGGRKQSETLKKGGLSGFLEMLNTLNSGDNVIQTADIPKGISRKVGLGIVNLAQKSGRPILPFAIASSRRYIFKNSWDKTALNLPFGTTAICVGDMIHVPQDKTGKQLEAYRDQLQEQMDMVTKRAYELTGKPE